MSIASLAMTAPVAKAGCVPEKPVKITTVSASPGLAPDHFARKPKVFYRVGKDKARLEEQLDPARNVHLLIIVNMPKAWFIDQVSRTAQVVSDERQPSKLYLPVISGETFPRELQDLEYGCEAQFIAHEKTAHERTEAADGLTLEHSVSSGRWKLTLAMREGSTQPVAARLSKDGKAIAVVEYLGYEILESIPDELFTLPVGVKVVPKPQP